MRIDVVINARTRARIYLLYIYKYIGMRMRIKYIRTTISIYRYIYYIDIAAHTQSILYNFALLYILNHFYA